MFHTGRPVVITEHGLVASPHYLATVAGLRILQEGGNAVDAAVTVSSTLHVTMPHQCSPGGDALWLIYWAESGKLHALNATGRAPYALSAEALSHRGLNRIPVRGAIPITVPGSVDGWFTALESFGTFSPGRLLEPAIAYADEGFPVNADLVSQIRQESALLGRSEAWSRIFLHDGCVPAVGQKLVQKDLAATLQQIAAMGCDCFYRGDLAARIAAAVQQAGGYLSLRDLANHHSDWVQPVRTSYRDQTIYEMPPNSRGAVVLIALNILEGFDLAALEYGSADLVHVVVAAYRLAKESFESAAGDPDFVQAPLERILSKEFAAGLRARIRTETAAVPVGTRPESPGDTVYVAVVDRAGNAVSLIDSTYYSFGSGLVVEGTGLTLQNRGAYFSLDPSHPNCLQPHKRTIHTLMPALAYRNGLPWLIFGSMGGDGQAQTQLQILTHLIDRGLNVQQAIEAPRWVYGGTLIGEQTQGLRLEDAFPAHTLKGLERLGYLVAPVSNWTDRAGVAQAIAFDREHRVYLGAADPRGEGCALGW